MSSCYAPLWRRILHKYVSCLFKKCPDSNYHWRWHRLCFCGCGEGSNIVDLKTQKEYIELTHTAIKEIEELRSEKEILKKVIRHFENCIEDEITDGFNDYTVNATCPVCCYKTMQVVRPGKFRCSLCDGDGLDERDNAR